MGKERILQTMIKSKYNSKLTLKYMTTNKENKFFDRKSAKVKPSDIAPWVLAFANAEGGTIIIGISDKTMRVEGINEFGEDKINQFLNIPKDYCRPMPEYKEEFIDVTNYKGKTDRILLLHIEPSIDRIIYMSNDSVWLRIGDRTRELKGEDIKRLEYEKGARHYEDEINEDAEIEDLDKDLWWNKLDSDEQKIVTFISAHKEVGVTEIEKIIDKSRRTINVKLNRLIDLGILVLNGNKYDSSHTYSISPKLRNIAR